MAVNLEHDVFAEMDEEIKEAKAKAASGTSNVFFFKLKDGEKALVRFLFDLRHALTVWKHEYYNNSTKTWEMSALCTQTHGIDLPTELCQHCQTAQRKLAEATTKDERKAAERMQAIKFYLYPVFVYGIKNKETGKDVTYKDKEGKEHPIIGVRYLQLKVTQPLMVSLRENYRELELGDSFLNHDITISLTCTNGDILKPVYTVMLRAPSKFAPPEGVEVPEQTHEDLFERLHDLWKPALIDQPDNDPFADAPPAQSNGNGAKGKVSNVPDF